MRDERNENIVNKDYIKVIPKNKKTLGLYLVVVISVVLLILSVIIRLWFDWNKDLIQKEEFIFTSVFILGAPLYISLLVLIRGCQSLIETVVISKKGIKYSNIFKKIECEWEDILKIEVITQRQRSEITGSTVSSVIDYNIHTSKGNFSINEERWGRDVVSLRNVYEKIISQVPHVVITQKDIEKTVYDGFLPMP